MLAADAKPALDAMAAAGAPAIDTLSSAKAKRIFLERAPQAAHVPVQLDEKPGQIHGFITMDGVIGDARRCIGRAVDAWHAQPAATGGR